MPIQKLYQQICEGCQQKVEPVDTCEKCNEPFGESGEDENGFNSSCVHCGYNAYYKACPECHYALPNIEWVETELDLPNQEILHYTICDCCYTCVHNVDLRTPVDYLGGGLRCLQVAEEYIPPWFGLCGLFQRSYVYIK